MANEKKTQQQQILADLAAKSSLTVYGSNTDLELESNKVKDIIKQTMVATSEKYGDRANGKVVNYFNIIDHSIDLSLSNVSQNGHEYL